MVGRRKGAQWKNRFFRDFFAGAKEKAHARVAALGLTFAIEEVSDATFFDSDVVVFSATSPTHSAALSIGRSTGLRGLLTLLKIKLTYKSEQ